MNRDVRDIALLFAAQLLLVLFWFTAGRTISGQYFAVAAVASALGVAIMLKALWRSHFYLRCVSWPYVVVAGAIAIGVAWILTDQALLGLWSIPSVLVLVLASFGLHRLFGPRFPDDGAETKR